MQGKKKKRGRPKSAVSKKPKKKDPRAKTSEARKKRKIQREKYKKAYRQAVEAEQAEEERAEEELSRPVRKAKFLGYCPACSTMVTTRDRKTQLIYECAFCGKRTRVSKLKLELGDGKKLSKKEYLRKAILNK